MSDIHTKTFEVEGHMRSVRFGSYAMMLIETELRVTARTVLSTFLKEQVGFREILVVLWAGLEGARVNNDDKTHRHDWNKAEAGRMMDALGGMKGTMLIIAELFVDAFQLKAEDLEVQEPSEEDIAKAETAEKKLEEAAESDDPTIGDG